MMSTKTQFMDPNMAKFPKLGLKELGTRLLRDLKYNQAFKASAKSNVQPKKADTKMPACPPSFNDKNINWYVHESNKENISPKALDHFNHGVTPDGMAMEYNIECNCDTCFGLRKEVRINRKVDIFAQ